MRRFGLRQLVVISLVAFVAAAALLLFGLLRRSAGWDLAIAIPSPVTPSVLWQSVAAVFAARPLEATALILVPGLALVATLACLATRVRSALTGSMHR